MSKQRSFFLFVLCILVILPFIGCSRPHYRVKADGEAYNLLASASRDPRWKLDDYRLDVDPRSRMFDRHDPDCEPMPPDDPASHRKMLRVDGKKGSKHWSDCGCTKCVENPCWKQYLLFNERGAVSLDKDYSFELALLHSPEYQSALENLYLSALNVSQERFRFDVQFYGGDSLFYTANGRLREGGATYLTNNAEIEATKLFATGGELVVGVANSITWTFNGQNSWYADSLLNFGLVQPLLRGAGRKVVLENLTQSERTFLAAIRQMAFFRQGFYTKIITGAGQMNMPAGSISASGTPTLGSGFYGLLANQIQIQNQRQNIIGLEDNLQRFEEIFKAGQMTDVYQVEETRQNLLASQSTLLGQIGSYEANVDVYLRSLGLPPDLPVEIADPIMEQFQLTSPSLIKLQENLGDLLAMVRKKDLPLPDDFSDRLKAIVRQTESEINSLHNDLDVLEKNVPKRIEGLRDLEANLSEQIRQGERIDPSIYDSERFRQRVEDLKTIDIPKNLRRLRATFSLIDLIIRNDEPTLRQLIREHAFEDNDLDALIILKLVESTPAEQEDELIRQLQDLEKSEEILRNLRKTIRESHVAAPGVPPLVPKVPSPETLREDEEKNLTDAQKIILELRKKDEYRDWIRRVLSAFQYEIVSLSLMQTQTRLDTITMIPTSITPEDAFRIASENRLDWMNRRSTLVDSWRQIDIAANRLKGDLNVKVEGELGTVDKRGVRFDGDNGRLRVGVEWDSPLTRHNEMLDYRRAQIDYQAARRDYYTYVDRVNADLRNILRNIRIKMVDFEIRRNAVLIATTRVDVKQLNMEQPASKTSKIDTNTASQLIDALNGLMTSQNTFMTSWVDYQTERMLLDLNMGTMELDERGRWIDPGVITKDRGGDNIRHGNPYGGAFASEPTLVPSKRRHHASKKGIVSVRPAEPQRIPPAPRLDDSSTPVLAPAMPEAVPNDLELPEVAPKPEEKLPEPQPLPAPESPQPKTSRKPVPRSALSPDTLPETHAHKGSGRSLKAPPPPKTPE